MTTQDIESGNRAIAGFDAEKVCHLCVRGVSYTAFRFERWPYWMPVISDLKYHSSWDWLKPLVDKIRATYDKLDFEHRIYVENNLIIYGLTIFVDIETVWKACVEFIEWYNKEQSAQASVATNSNKEQNAG